MDCGGGGSPTAQHTGLRPAQCSEIVMELEQEPNPWYKSKIIISSTLTTIIGLAVAVGMISPEKGSILTGNLEPIVGVILTVTGLVSIYGRSQVTKVAAGTGSGPVTTSVSPTVAMVAKDIVANDPSVKP